MDITRQQFRDGASRLGAAVSIITTAGEGGRCGFTASAVCSVTDTPPTLLVCMNRSSAQHAAFRTNRTLCVNVLAAEQHHLSGLFAGQTAASMDERFAAAHWSVLATAAPALEGAAVCMDCVIRDVIEHGTHSIFLAEVAMIQIGPDDSGGLIWFARRYHGVGNANSAPLPESLRSAL